MNLLEGVFFRPARVEPHPPVKPRMVSRGRRGHLKAMERVDRELWLMLSLFAIAGLLNYFLIAQHMLLDLYILPALFSAYHYGRRHAVLTAFASIFMVILLVWWKPEVFGVGGMVAGQRWYQITAWGGILVLVAYSMGTLHERSRQRLHELRESYHGILMILQQFIAKDKYTQNHCYRVSFYARVIGAQLGMDNERLEDIRAAALLHDIGKLDISRELLYKAARLNEVEFQEIQRHVELGMELLAPVGGTLRRVLPIILAHHDKYDGSGYHPTQGTQIPLEARIITVADVYDALTSDRPYRQAMSPYDAKNVIVRGAGTEFDPQVVDAFLEAFRGRELEIPEVVV